MRLSLFTDYSLRVLMFAAGKSEPFSISEVADAYQISRHHLVKIVNHLSHLGYLETRRGRGGGIRLGQPAADIQLGNVARQTESSDTLVECFDPTTNTCPLHLHCQLKNILTQAQNAFFDELNRHTLADIATGSRGRAIINSLRPLSS